MTIPLLIAHRRVFLEIFHCITRKKLVQNEICPNCEFSAFITAFLLPFMMYVRYNIQKSTSSLQNMYQIKTSKGQEEQPCFNALQWHTFIRVVHALTCLSTPKIIPTLCVAVTSYFHRKVLIKNLFLHRVLQEELNHFRNFSLNRFVIR